MNQVKSKNDSVSIEDIIATLEIINSEDVLFRYVSHKRSMLNYSECERLNTAADIRQSEILRENEPMPCTETRKLIRRY
jgi:hypothetical protein